MDKKKLITSLIAGILALIMILSLVVGILPAAKAATSSEIKTQLDELQKDHNELAGKIKDLEGKLNANATEVKEMVDQKRLVEQQINLLYMQVDNMNDQIAAYSVMIADIQEDLDEAELRLKELNEKNRERIRAMEEQGELSYWSVLFEASSFMDLLDRLNMIEEIQTADRLRLKQLREAAQLVAETKQSLVTEKQDLQKSKESLEASQSELDAKIAQLKAEAGAYNEAIDNQINEVDPTKEVRKMSLLEVNARYALAYDKFIEKYGYDAIAVSCWPKFQDDYLFSVCAVVGEINDKGVVCGCEGDLTSTVSQLLLSYIAEDITMLMDLSAMDENDNSIMMWHCGPAAKRFCEKKGYSYSLNYSGKDHEGRDLDHAVGTGITRDMVFDDDVYTIARLTGESNKMFLASGVMQDGSKASYNGSRGWLGQLKLNRKDISALDFFNTIMVHGFQHHFPMVKGDYTEEVMEVMAWLGLEGLEAVPYENYLQR